MSAKRPERRIEHGFTVEAVGSEFLDGEYRYGVKCGIAIVRSGLREREAQELARALNWAADGLAEHLGLRRPDRQLLLLGGSAA